MTFSILHFFLSAIVAFASLFVTSSEINALALKTTDNLVFSAIRGKSSRPDTVTLAGGLQYISWLNGDSSSFRTSTRTDNKIIIAYAPAANFIGISRARIRLYLSDRSQWEISLTGLSTKALEGENEAPLAQILDVLQYPVNIGWTTLGHHCRPELQGEELVSNVFEKAGSGPVQIIPIARYSPDFELEFGYYFLRADTVVRKHVGTLSKAGKFPEHQTLYPQLSAGGSVFDPGRGRIGFYAKSPSHIAYTQDTLNKKYFPEHVAHATRIYPLRADPDGKVQVNSYLVCFEEAKNGDYNDYVFIVKNVKPVVIGH
jgi:hypothetical protein